MKMLRFPNPVQVSRWSQEDKLPDPARCFSLFLKPNPLQLCMFPQPEQPWMVVSAYLLDNNKSKQANIQPVLASTGSGGYLSFAQVSYTTGLDGPNLDGV
jgi:hypothetical protein